MKDVEEIKKEIARLLNEAARQGVMIESIFPEYAVNMEGTGALIRMEIVEKRV